MGTETSLTSHDHVDELGWTRLQQCLEAADPDAPPPPELLATAFAEFWPDLQSRDDETPITVVDIGLPLTSRNRIRVPSDHR